MTYPAAAATPMVRQGTNETTGVVVAQTHGHGHDEVDPNLGISRRTLLRRGMVVGGSLVWAAPAVQSFSKAALAQTEGTPCTICVFRGNRVVGRCETTQECCDCLENADPGDDCDPQCEAFDCEPATTCP
jgi:hypothetical protein